MRLQGGGVSSSELVTHFFSLQFEVENAALRETNKQQAAQLEELKKQVQGEGFYWIIDPMM